MNGALKENFIFQLGGTGFHNNAVIVNPQDLAPNYSGSVFGLMNTFGAIPGNITKVNSNKCVRIHALTYIRMFTNINRLK